MQNLIPQLHHLLIQVETSKFMTFIYAASLIIAGYFIAKRLSIIAENTLNKRFSRHHTILSKRSTFYLVFAIFLISALEHLGFKLSVLLGAAGVFTVAISFASQTAASNLISGVFLLFERPFKIGDVVTVNGTNGVIDSIDLLSTKLKTSDNTLVRIPNETMIKSDITNLSYFPTRRITLLIAVPYESDLHQVTTIITDIANHCEQVLKNPAPNVTINNFGLSAVEVKLLIWVNTTEAVAVKNDLFQTIKKQCHQEGMKNITEIAS